MKQQQSGTNFDVVILGGGVAGLSAALWCDELKLSALVLEAQAELGGQLLWVYNEIKNYLGAEAESGRELLGTFLTQIEKRAFELRLNAQIAGVDLEKKEVSLVDGVTFTARALVIATGIRRRKLNVEGEDDFAGRGLIESGKRDAREVAGGRVVIVGGGDAALENALILAETASHVTLVHRRRDFRARAEFTEKVKTHSKIEIFTEAGVRKISGGERLETVEIEHLSSGERRVLPADALLLRIGVEPNTELFRGRLKLDENGYLDVDRDCRTSAAGVFAAGDVANPLAPTVASAAGMGATAAKAIFSLLNY